MRIWDVDPGFLNDRSLLGEHRELHGLFSIHTNDKKGYAGHPETLRWKLSLNALSVRHGLLVSEMHLRGFNHKSPLEPDVDVCGALRWPDRFINLPSEQFSILEEKYRDKPRGRIPLPRNTQALWASHKYSVMARDPARYRELGPRVAHRDISFSGLSRLLVDILRTPPREGRLVNAVDHMWGYVSRACPGCPETCKEKLSEIRARARNGAVPYLWASTAPGELAYWADRI